MEAECTFAISNFFLQLPQDVSLMAVAPFTGARIETSTSYLVEEMILVAPFSTIDQDLELQLGWLKA